MPLFELFLAVGAQRVDELGGESDGAPSGPGLGRDEDEPGAGLRCWPAACHQSPSFGACMSTGARVRASSRVVRCGCQAERKGALDMGWEDAGRAWGARALEWAYLNEPYAIAAHDLILGRLEVGVGTRYLDVACGSGLAASTARRRGADVAGLDASEALIQIARARTEDGDFRVGDMFALPFESGSFDVVTSFNGIWKGCELALAEAGRVLSEAGRLGLTFWGRPERMGLLPYFMKIIELSPPSHQMASMEQGDTGRAGVVEEMLAATGFEVIERGTVDAINEWVDVPTAVRALAAAGPTEPAIGSVGYDAFCAALTETLTPLYDPDLGVRVVSELGWVTAQLSSTRGT